MSELSQKLPEAGQIPASNRDILAKQSGEVRKIVADDPILSQNLDQITNIREFFKALSQNIQIFTQTDNPLPKKSFLEQHIKGLVYGQIASNGEDFSLVKTVEEGKQRVKDGKWTREDLRNWREWNEKTDEQAAIARKTEEGNIDKAAIERSEQFRKLEGFVKSAQDSLNPEGKNLLENNVKTLKGDPQKLQTLGIPQGEENNPQYESLLRASVLRGLAQDQDFAEKYVDASRKDQFTKSIDEIGKLGIVAYPVSQEKISKHIDARFPKSEATDRGKKEIENSIISGDVRSVYYDGQGEKYTLIGKDGKTVKEVYMKPPRTVIRDGFLSISRETPKREPSASERAKQDIRTSIQKDIASMSVSPFVGALESSRADSGKVDFFLAKQSEKPEDQLRYTYSALMKKRSALEILAKDMREKGEENEATMLDIAKRQVEDQIQKIEELAKNYARILKENTEEPKVQDGFESTARINLTWLTTKHIDNIGTRANEALYRIVGELNKTRKADPIVLEQNDITLKKNTGQKEALERALVKVTGGERNLTDSDRLTRVKEDINMMLSYPPSHPMSIESHVNGTYEASYKA